MFLIKFKKWWSIKMDFILEKICGPDSRTILADIVEYLRVEMELGSDDKSKYYAWLHKNCPLWVEVSDNDALLDYTDHQGALVFEKLFTYPDKLRRDRIDMIKKKLKKPVRLLIKKSQEFFIRHSFLKPIGR